MNDSLPHNEGTNSTLTSGDLPPLPPRYGMGETMTTASATATMAPPPPPPAPIFDATPPYLGAQPAAPAAPNRPAKTTKGVGKGFVLFTSFMAAILGAVMALGGVWLSGTLNRPNAPVATTTPTGEKVVAASAGGKVGNVDVVDIARRVRPEIVNVQVQGNGVRGSGSGVIFRPDGYIMTNNHVVADMSSIKVEFTDGRTLNAKVVGTDPATDIAVVKVDAKDLPAATLGNSGALEIGQPVIAIGYPLGLEGGPSVSTGVISAKGREVATGPEGGRSGETLVDMLQTDAPISPGSSGGALLDGNGAVIGVTTAKAGADANADNIGFATPIDVARKVADQLITTGKVQHPLIGIQGFDQVDQRTGEVTGALVRAVQPGGAADAAGIKAGDVIVSVNGKPVDGMASLRTAVRTKAVGDKLTLGIERNGKTQNVTVTLGN